jgi:hypothetical protein
VLLCDVFFEMISTICSSGRAAISESKEGGQYELCL